MEESTWYTKQRSQLEESLWILKQQFRVLQDYRQDIRGIWQDDAASEINGRYFYPHEEDTNQSLTALNQQLSSLQQTDAELEIARQHGLEITRLLDEAKKLLDSAREDMSRSHSEYSLFREQNSSARAELPAIAQLINQANSY